ncbi:MAG TPA: hypothetical protein DCO65_04125 [Spartobacteria bacterium]|jgi:hypothetical protein|nr:hypothetical protein [Spartobacteria bacterium]HAK06447.1 hypothetical protein [Spartobacteria bacterium]HCP91598.1 hypothetical protein [Spartobacteria bacterium]
MPDWKMTGTYFKSCNCDPGCPCDFMSEPTRHKCEGVLGMKVDKGHFDGVSLDGVKWAVAYHWPGPLHEGNGTVKPYFDPATTKEQLDSLGKILTGQAGGKWFEVLATIVTTVKDPAIVPIDFQFKGKRGKIKIGSGIENDFAPISNPVTGDEFAVQVRIPGGMEYSDTGEAEIVRSAVMRSTDEIAFDHEGGHTSYIERQTFGSHR